MKEIQIVNMATTKQKMALTKLSENVRKSGKKPGNLGAALKAAGYSESVCKSPQRVTKSKGWTELLDEYFPGYLVLERHRKLLDNEDPKVVSRALDMAYKLRGSYNSNTTNQITSQFQDWTDEDLESELKRLRRSIKN